MILSEDPRTNAMYDPNFNNHDESYVLMKSASNSYPLAQTVVHNNNAMLTFSKTNLSKR